MKRKSSRAGNETRCTMKSDRAKESVFVKTLRVYEQPVFHDLNTFKEQVD